MTQPHAETLFGAPYETLAQKYRPVFQRIRETALQREHNRQLGVDAIQWLKQAGFGAVRVPAEYGGDGATLPQLFQLLIELADADSNIVQALRGHFAFVEDRLNAPRDAGNEVWLRRFVAGDLVGNAWTEVGDVAIGDVITRISKRDGRWVANGRKYYSTGSIFADWVDLYARLEDGTDVIAAVSSHQPGVTHHDDWNGFGQRTTGSGSAVFENVHVPADAVIGFATAFSRPTQIGPMAQIQHAAIDLGIARAAYADLLQFVRTRSRPWVDSGVERAGDDPLTIREVGDLTIQLHAAEALVRRAGRKVDAAAAKPTEDSIAEASIAVAEARVLTTEVSLAAGSKLFELAGSQSTLSEHNLDRHWRNARTHTLHDPVRWKYHAIGNYVLNGKKPPRHGAI